MIERILHASIYDAIGLLRNYRSLVPKLVGPRGLLAADAALKLFHESSPADIEQLRMEFLRGNEYFVELNMNYVDTRRLAVPTRPWDEFLYILVRTLRPAIVFETGVFDGQASTIILAAMQKNCCGTLVSIDLPAIETITGATDKQLFQTLPPGKQPGWAVPDDLRSRYRLELGDSKEYLPRLLAEYGQIDIFFHDSLHTDAHMTFEYTTAWPYVRPGGVLLSDDIFWNAAFFRFSRQVEHNYVRVGNFGAIRK